MGELIDYTDVTDATWEQYDVRYAVQQIFDFVMLICLSRMAGGFFNVTGAQSARYLPTRPDSASD